MVLTTHVNRTVTNAVTHESLIVEHCEQAHVVLYVGIERPPLRAEILDVLLQFRQFVARSHLIQTGGVEVEEGIRCDGPIPLVRIRNRRRDVGPSCGKWKGCSIHRQKRSSVYFNNLSYERRNSGSWGCGLDRLSNRSHSRSRSGLRSRNRRRCDNGGNDRRRCPCCRWRCRGLQGRSDHTGGSCPWC